MPVCKVGLSISISAFFLLELAYLKSVDDAGLVTYVVMCMIFVD